MKYDTIVITGSNGATEPYESFEEEVEEEVE